MLALIITAAVIARCADRGAVRFYALVGIAAYPAGWLAAFIAWEGDVVLWLPISLVFIMLIPAAIAGARAWRQYRIRSVRAAAVGALAGLAIGLAALAFAWGFHANSYVCPISFGPVPTQPCQGHFNPVVFTLIAGGVPPVIAAGAAWVADTICRRRARTQPP